MPAKLPCPTYMQKHTKYCAMAKQFQLTKSQTYVPKETTKKKFQTEALFSGNVLVFHLATLPNVWGCGSILPEPNCHNGSKKEPLRE